MVDTNTKNDFLKGLNKDIGLHKTRYRFWVNLQRIVTIMIAVAGAITATSGAAGTPKPGDTLSWFKEPNTLLICGLVAAIGAAINQWGLGTKSEAYRKVELAMRGIRDAFEAEIIQREKAALLRIKARTQPEQVLEELCKIKEPMG